MKIRILVGILVGLAVLGAERSAQAQRRGTGVSTLQTVDPAATDAEIAETEGEIQEGVSEMDSEATAQEKTEETLQQDNLAADEAAPQPGPLEPVPMEGGIDDLSADLPPIEDELPTGQLSPDELPDPGTLIPEDIYAPSPSDFDLPPEAPPAPAVVENEFEKERKLRVRFQEVKLQALKDQAIRDMRVRADSARTDEDKRAALREYYRMLFAKIVSIDPALDERSKVLESAYLRRVGQFRVEPTIPLNPPPTPAPLETEL